MLFGGGAIVNREKFSVDVSLQIDEDNINSLSVV